MDGRQRSRAVSHTSSYFLARIYEIHYYTVYAGNTTVYAGIVTNTVVVSMTLDGV